jgi:selT/selW/selH-like putative selenoprotein
VRIIRPYWIRHKEDAASVNDGKKEQIFWNCLEPVRAGSMDGQELPTTFEKEVGDVALIPGTDAVFEVMLNRDVIFSRKQQGRFPESKELKQLIRDRIAPSSVPELTPPM